MAKNSRLICPAEMNGRADQMREFDAIVIGIGTAGSYLVGRLAKAGKRVAAIERNLFGGTCINFGCTPTKALVASAYAAHLARRASNYGVIIDSPVRVDMKRIQARKTEIVAPREREIEEWITSLDNCTVYRGQAKFVASRQIQIADEILTADQIFLSVGGRASVPPIAGLADVHYHDNASILELDTLPEHLLIIGGSYIGLEFAQMFRRFGSAVSVIEMGPRLIQREDKDISDAVYAILEKEEVNIYLSSTCISANRSGSSIEVQLHGPDRGPLRLTGSHLLVATGRRPNTDDLGLEHTGIKLDTHGFIAVDDYLRTSEEGVFALGDCNGRSAFTHMAYNDFEIVAGNLLDGDQRSLKDRIQAYALYIDPPLGRAGATELDLRKAGRPTLVGKLAMSGVARAVEKGETEGFMKIYVDRESKLIAGAAILGSSGDEAIHCILDIMYARVPYTVITRAAHIHPTVSELIPTMLSNLAPL